jgi:hypothetical protein
MLIDITHKDRDIIPGASFHVKWIKREKQMQQLLVRVERDTCRSNRPKIFLWGLELFLFFRVFFKCGFHRYLPHFGTGNCHFNGIWYLQFFGVRTSHFP